MVTSSFLTQSKSTIIIFLEFFLFLIFCSVCLIRFRGFCAANMAKGALLTGKWNAWTSLNKYKFENVDFFIRNFIIEFHRRRCFASTNLESTKKRKSILFIFKNTIIPDRIRPKRQQAPLQSENTHTQKIETLQIQRFFENRFNENLIRYIEHRNATCRIANLLFFDNEEG